jgi:hypothetical protein
MFGKAGRSFAGLATAVLLSGILVASSAAAQCCMWCPNGAGTPREFSTVQRAQAGCGGDEIVWVQDRPRVYHKAGWPKFGKTPGGSFICKASSQLVNLHQANLFQRFL